MTQQTCTVVVDMLCGESEIFTHGKRYQATRRGAELDDPTRGVWTVVDDVGFERTIMVNQPSAHLPARKFGLAPGRFVLYVPPENAGSW